MVRIGIFAASFVGCVATAYAGEVPLYKATPEWVRAAPLPAGGEGKNLPLLVIADSQQKIEAGTLWSYVDSALFIGNPEALAQLSTIAVQWAPDKGDLIIHEASIMRGAEKIDLLTAGKTFTVLRREQNLEQRQLDGTLTATLLPEGIRVGDTLRIRYTTTAKDMALQGRIQNVAPLIAAPIKAEFGRARVLWPGDIDLKWHVLRGTGFETSLNKANGFNELQISYPGPKQPDMPADAPLRYRHSALFELSSFSGWGDVSKTIAPLFRTSGLIADGSPLDGEVKKIMARETSQTGRAQEALRLVQDQVRYLAIMMNGGNYVPQKPAETWSVRFGDCKAKTLLLLSMLHRMGIEAEPILASSTAGDVVPGRLPSVAAFDHILVRAVIGEKVLWLDGTQNGSRLEDIYDTPPLGYVLPLRAAGADPIHIDTRPNARPDMDIVVDADESTSVDLPSAFKATAVARSRSLGPLAAAVSSFDAKQRRDIAGLIFGRVLDDATIADAAISLDPDRGTITFKVSGMYWPWKWEDRQKKRSFSGFLQNFKFAPERAKADWAAIPVATPPPGKSRFRLNLRLPNSGSGFIYGGAKDEHQSAGGAEIVRSGEIRDGVLTFEETVGWTGAEITPDQFPSERSRVAMVRSKAPNLVAPAGTPRIWDLNVAAVKSTPQFASLNAVFVKMIANDPADISAYSSRADVLARIGDRKAALADLDHAIAIAPDQETLVARGELHKSMGDLPAALADAQRAYDLDSSNLDAATLLSTMLAQTGALAKGVAVLDERIALGGDNQEDFKAAKLELLGEYGEASEALRVSQEMIAENPGRPRLLNASCWIKGSRNVAIDTAIKECTRAIELSSDSSYILDSRAMAWFRLGKLDDALADLNAAINEAPDLGGSRFLRGVVLARLGRSEDSKNDLRIARALQGDIDAQYRRFGIVP